MQPIVKMNKLCCAESHRTFGKTSASFLISMPAHIGPSSQSNSGRSYNNSRAVTPSRMILAIVGLVSVAIAVYIAESYPKRLAHSLPRVYQDPLPYSLYALEPYISAETMDYHYNKHDYGYDTKLQSLVTGTELANMSLAEIVSRNTTRQLPAGVYNNAGQLINHNIFWESMTADTAKHFPKGLSPQLGKQIVTDFKTVDAFVKDFTTKATNWFGSGWTHAVFNKGTGKLEVVNTANGNVPMPPTNYIVLFNLDVWEHAYYIDYRNRRDEYIRNFWHVVNWKSASDRFGGK